MTQHSCVRIDCTGLHGLKSACGSKAEDEKCRELPFEVKALGHIALWMSPGTKTTCRLLHSRCSRVLNPFSNFSFMRSRSIAHCFCDTQAMKTGVCSAHCQAWRLSQTLRACFLQCRASQSTQHASLSHGSPIVAAGGFQREAPCGFSCLGASLPLKPGSILVQSSCCCILQQHITPFSLFTPPCTKIPMSIYPHSSTEVPSQTGVSIHEEHKAIGHAPHFKTALITTQRCFIDAPTAILVVVSLSGVTAGLRNGQLLQTHQHGCVRHDHAEASPAQESGIQEASCVHSQQLMPHRDLPEVDCLECRPENQLCSVGAQEVPLALLFHILHSNKL